MNNYLLYSIVVMIWGSTWYAITLQLGVVSPTVSVFYRFLLAAVLSFGVCLATKKNLRFNRREHLWLAAQGLCMFCANYILTYSAEANVSSAIVAVGFTLLIHFNMIGMRVVYKQKLEPKILLSGIIGVLGVFSLFYNEITRVGNNPNSVKGIIFAVVGTLVASVGNLISVRIRRHSLPVFESNAWSMLYGSLMTALFAIVIGDKFSFLLNTSYVGSLFYLSIFGSIIAFFAYNTLIGSIGASRAAYTGVLTPVIALIISTIFENFHWSPIAFVGAGLCVFGNYLII